MRTSQKSFIALLALAILMGGYYLFTTPKKVPVVVSQTSSTTSGSLTKSYIGSDFSFVYPTVLQTLQDNETVTITHFIPYTHTNPCDFKGDGPQLTALTDFSMTIKVASQGVEDYVKISGSPDWSYVSQNPYTLGAWSGYHVTLGVEGCGEDLYYISASPNKTVAITRPTVAEFAPVNGDVQTYLALPGIITPTTSEAYFREIVSSLKVR
jgi:hypothetical protein